MLPSNPTEEFHKWTHGNTLIFLDLYQKYRGQVGSLKVKNLKRMFELIATEMQVITKIQISASHCENRWKVLERNYKKYIDNSKLTGSGRVTFEYAEIMYSILGKKKNIHPVLLLSSDTISTPGPSPTTTKEQNGEEINIEVTSEEVTTSESIPTREKKRKANDNVKKPVVTGSKRLKFNILKDIRTERQEYYKKRLELEEKKLLEKVRKNNLLQKYFEENMYAPEFHL
ncbi:hypothetical protein ABEB36_001418 [Hypothenemus hampei]|uniref:Myb/SANT-like DNA-binding domain-containing protein n=1 Tax=Hypothenemus hampei TaxID=57062 RepID=A0ABD1FI16_HYPHA